MKTRQTLLASLLLAAATTLVSAPSFAQRGNCDYGPMGERGPGMRADRMKAHQQRLHDALKLTPEQEKAWTTFQSSHPMSMRDERPNRADFDKLTAPERAEKMLEMQKKHQESMSQHLTAMKAFYEQLTPEQRKVFDQHPMQRPNQGPRGQRPMPGGNGGPAAPGTPPTPPAR